MFKWMYIQLVQELFNDDENDDDDNVIVIVMIVDIM